ncbi:hypothetical protein V8G54_021652, partial [Vigna mungo]
TIEITREIESSVVVKYEEFEADFATEEAYSIKIYALLQFDIVGYVTVDGSFYNPLSKISGNVAIFLILCLRSWHTKPTYNRSVHVTLPYLSTSPSQVSKKLTPLT